MTRLLAKLFGYKYYQHFGSDFWWGDITVYRTSDGYAFHNEREFFKDSGETNWRDVGRKNIIF